MLTSPLSTPSAAPSTIFSFLPSSSTLPGCLVVSVTPPSPFQSPLSPDEVTNGGGGGGRSPGIWLPGCYGVAELGGQ
ncbi:hypothetical protein GUJ93_ZPchr0005g15065 [Zizania palustris]|uniref:Uncharacterized protein n=1 Tax=Zizania palustris TaxID=103762 RepID=A0A8J5T8N8_ZIZPA|nr:hypothetical protein GUJ93_ZPchr0005g15065 [Zizania palustris]